MIPFFCDETDDPKYIDLVSDIVNGLLIQSKVDEVFTVKIRDWFGPKWLGFCGKALGAVAVHRWPPVLPPFHPNRVLLKRFYSWDLARSEYVEADSPVQLHIQQESMSNLSRKLERYVDSGALIWFSSGTKPAGNGALMVYLHNQNYQWGWYVGFTKGKNGWRWRGDLVSDVELTTWYELGKAERLKAEPLPSLATASV